MATIRRSPAWPDLRVKPSFGAAQINWGHPLANQLVAAVLINEGGGLPRNLVRSDAFSSTAPPSWTIGPNGLALDGNGTTQYAGIGRAFIADYPGTMMMVGEAVGTAQHNIVSVAYTGSNTASLGVRMGDGTSLILSGWIYNTSAFTSTNGATTLTAGRTYTGLHVWNTATSRILYLNGVQDGSSTSSQTMVAGMNTSDMLRLNRTTVIYYPGKKLALWYVWTRALSATEALWLHAEPYAFLQPVIRRRWFALAAAEAPTGGVVTPRSLGLLGVGA